MKKAWYAALVFALLFVYAFSACAAEPVAEWAELVEEGNVIAQYNLALCYYYGYGTEPDHAEAAGWLKKVAEQGDVNAGFMLGTCYADGEGTDQDAAAAAEWLEKAAELGRAPEQ